MSRLTKREVAEKRKDKGAVQAAALVAVVVGL